MTALSVPTAAAEPVGGSAVAGLQAGLERAASAGDGAVPQPAGGAGLPAGRLRPLDTPPAPGPAGQRGEGQPGSKGAAPDRPPAWDRGRGLPPLRGGGERGGPAGQAAGAPHRSL